MRSACLGVASIGLFLSVLLVVGCAGGSVPAGGEVPASPTNESLPATSTDSTFHATLYTGSGQIDVEDFTVDTSNRKFNRQLWGFRPRDLNKMTAIPFRGVQEIQIIGAIPDDDFTIIFNVDERRGLRKDEMFDTRIRYPDGTIIDFYAIIAGLRGYRDVQRWDHAFAGNPLGVQRIEFR